VVIFLGLENKVFQQFSNLMFRLNITDFEIQRRANSTYICSFIFYE